jgi:hypothetical protein
MRVFGRLTYFLIVLMVALWPVAAVRAALGGRVIFVEENGKARA